MIASQSAALSSSGRAVVPCLRALPAPAALSWAVFSPELLLALGQLRPLIPSALMSWRPFSLLSPQPMLRCSLLYCDYHCFISYLVWWLRSTPTSLEACGSPCADHRNRAQPEFPASSADDSNASTLTMGLCGNVPTGSSASWSLAAHRDARCVIHICRMLRHS